MFQKLIIALNLIEVPLCFCAFWNNLLLFYLLKHRKPFTTNVRLLLCVAALCHCFVMLWMFGKAICAIIGYYSNISFVLSKNICFGVSGTLAFVPMEVSGFSIWLILFERLYTSLKFKKNSEISKRVLGGTLVFAIIIAFILLLFFYLISDDKPISEAYYCNIFFFTNSTFIYEFLFFFTGEAFVFLSFIWIKQVSLKYIEKFTVNCSRSKLETRFQLKKNIEVTKAVLPLLLMQSIAGLFALMFGIYLCLLMSEVSARLLSIEIICYILAPVYFMFAPLVLMWKEPKLRPKIQINHAEIIDSTSIDMTEETSKEGDLRLQTLESQWNYEFDRKLANQ